MTDPTSFRLLHLSDLHAGMSGQSLLWPNVKEVFFRDLTTLKNQVGEWDAVLFSGDFAQKGANEEFDEVIVRLLDIWRHFESLGFKPTLICIPGNHDIQRPDARRAEVRVLKKWFEEREIWDDFFRDNNDTYRHIITGALSGYERFVANLASTSIPLARAQIGLLPGDQLISFHDKQITLGVMGLNSTWLQITGDEYKGTLSVDLRQVNALQPEVGKWCGANHFNIVVTHHPLDWLHPSSLDTWYSEINPPGRFDLHLFGHMHEPFSMTLGISGAANRHSLQAPSLFGMEMLADGKTNRIHGYSLLSFETLDNARRIRIWPRRLLGHKSGQQRFVADNEFVLEDDKYFTINLQTRLDSAPAPVNGSPSKTLQAADVEHQERDVLRPLNYHLALPSAHRRVRRAEQQQCLETLESARALWLTSEWGMGSDEFLASVMAQRSTQSKSFRLDACEYSDKDTFSAEVARKLGCSFAQFCDALSSESAFLILDDIPTGVEPPIGSVALENDIESFVEVLVDACPNLWVALRSLKKPTGNTLVSLQLAPLDEADIKLYVGDHERGGPKLTTIDAIAILYRHTDGYPTRLDARLKELTVVSIEELSSSGEDTYSGDGSQSDAPLLLKRAVHELSEAGDKPTRRMFDMLKALLVFPQGAELSRIKRFNGVNPFYPADALGLMDRALITVSETPEVGNSETNSSQKILVVPRPIRDYLRTLVNEEALDSLNMRAAILLFGPDWMSGSKDWPPHLDYSSSWCGSADIANASALLIRLFRLHRENPASREAVALVLLAASFAEALCDGSHYTSAANFCRDFHALMGPDDSAEKRAGLIRQQGYALRMLGDRVRAKTLLKEVLDFPFPKVTRQSVLIDLALCHKADRESDAMEYAKEILRINRNNSHGYQAQQIIIELEPASSDRTRKLTELERKARKNKFYVVAENIALTRAKEAASDDAAAAILDSVLKGPENGDLYNKSRAALELIN
ncbi:metallophosphoesterase family protein [Mesorhizobium erdmanii]|uniref:Calcineurin-like phosphoesterase domain-containing protein n=1 Tax=Mesorhizobium erdmanii TaxID=1777866 RepID=A0A6M7UH97_9HYPH|nr:MULTISPECIES: metallophosphoesterase family protein [Mesorhizobium]OBQ70969.1 hypothetical protein A8146_26230 [Mesorhizobium loti]QKC76604.1 hypothetical protein EB233_14645 [Mesorhizobium erdmanii]